MHAICLITVAPGRSTHLKGNNLFSKLTWVHMLPSSSHYHAIISYAQLFFLYYIYIYTKSEKPCPIQSLLCIVLISLLLRLQYYRTHIRRTLNCVHTVFFHDYPKTGKLPLQFNKKL